MAEAQTRSIPCWVCTRPIAIAIESDVAVAQLETHVYECLRETVLEGAKLLREEASAPGERTFAEDVSRLTDELVEAFLPAPRLSRSEDATPDLIVCGPDLFLGSASVFDTTSWFERERVGAIVCAAPECALDTDEQFQAVGVPREHYHVYNLEDIPSYPCDEAFLSAASVVCAHRRAGRSVLVHCRAVIGPQHAGVSRSASIVITALMLNGLSLAAALVHTRTARPVAYPNPGFIAALMRIERHIRRHGAQAATTPLPSERAAADVGADSLLQAGDAAVAAHVCSSVPACALLLHVQVFGEKAAAFRKRVRARLDAA